MKIFIHEYVSGGGLSGQPLPRRMAHEGLLMLGAILEDFHAWGAHEIRSTLDGRLRAAFRSDLPVTIIDRHRFTEIFAACLDWADAVFLVAPETDGVLEQLTAMVEAAGKRLLGSSRDAVAAAGDKAIADTRFRAAGFSIPRACVIPLDDEPIRQVTTFGFPAVIKPIDGAGCEGTSLVRRRREVPAALRRLRRATRRETFLLQEYVAGAAASLCCLSDGTHVLPLTLNTQYISIRDGSSLGYGGGTVHIDHPSRLEAFRMAQELPHLFQGLKGYFGADLILTRSGPVFIEVNPRLTTSYVGLRRAVSVNLAEAIVKSALGQLPRFATPKGPVRFFIGGGRGTARARG